MARRRYSGYSGRTTARDVLRLVAVLLAVLLALTVVALMFGQRYIMYTDEGVRLELPFFQREEASLAESSTPLDIVQMPGTSRPQAQESPEEPAEGELIN